MDIHAVASEHITDYQAHLVTVERRTQDIKQHGFLNQMLGKLDHVITIGLLAGAVAETPNDQSAESLAAELGVDLDAILDEPERLVDMTQDELRNFVFNCSRTNNGSGTLSRGGHTGEGLVTREIDA